MDEMTYEEKLEEQRKREKIEYRNKKRTSSTFMFFASVFEIIETFIIIMVLLLVAFLLAIKVFNIQEGPAVTIFQISILILFIAGIIIGFNIYKKVVRWAIKKFNLQDKLLDDVLDHYKTKEEKLKEREEKLTV